MLRSTKTKLNSHIIPKIGLALCLTATLALAGCATRDSNPSSSASQQKQQVNTTPGGEYNENELVSAVSTHLGVTSESAGSMIERLFRSQGRPVGYITGEEVSAAVVGGLRYGKGTLWMKNGTSQKVYWQGPSVGFDWGANGSKVFTLVYDLQNPDYIYRRYPGVDGSAFFIAGMAANYQRADGVTLAPIRTGVGLRLGANIGYLSYSRKRKWLPL